MNLNVRFYWQHDIDLIGLVKHPEFDMAKAIQTALRAYVHHDESVRIALPPPPSTPIQLESCVVSVYFSPKKDQDIVEFLLSVRYGFRNSLIKNLVRKYLAGFYDVPYNTESLFQVYRRQPKTKAREKKKTEQKRLNKNVVSTTPKKKKGTTSRPIQSQSRFVSSPPPAPTNPVPSEPSITPKPKIAQAQHNPVVSHSHSVQSEPPMKPETTRTEETNENEDGFDLFGKIGDMMGQT